MGTVLSKLAGALLVVAVLAGCVWLFRREGVWSGLPPAATAPGAVAPTPPGLATRPLGGTSPTPPVAAVAPYAIAAASGMPSGSAGAALDGDPRTAWLTAQPTPPADAALVLDLGTLKSIARLRWYIATPTAAAGFQIQVSDDGRVWRTVPLPTGGSTLGWHDLVVQSRGRFVRWRLTNARQDRQLGGLGEVAVYPPPGAPVPSPTPAAKIPATRTGPA